MSDTIVGSGARKSRKRGLTVKQKAATLFQLWHCIQEVKEEAERLQDEELSLLVGMIELAVEERTAGLSRAHGSAFAAADTTRPN